MQPDSYDLSQIQDLTQEQFKKLESKRITTIDDLESTCCSETGIGSLSIYLDISDDAPNLFLEEARLVIGEERTFLILQTQSVGRHWRFRKVAIDKWLEESTPEGSQGRGER